MESRVEKRDMLIMVCDGNAKVKDLVKYFDISESKYGEVNDVLKKMKFEVISLEDEIEEDFFDQYVTRINRIVDAPQEAYDDLVHDTICELIVCDYPYEKAMDIFDQRGFSLDEEFKGVSEDEYYSRLSIAKPRQHWAGLSELIENNHAKFSKWLRIEDFPISQYHEV